MNLISERWGSRGSWVSSEDYSRQAGAAAIPENARRQLRAETRFSRGFWAKLSLPNQQDLWKNRACRRGTIGAAGVLEHPGPRESPVEGNQEPLFFADSPPNVGSPTGGALPSERII